MFNVFVNDGNQEMPDDDVLYIICKEGIYLKKNLGIMESITPVKNVSTLASVEMMAQMHIKPIPAYQFAQVESFFRAVYKEHRSEAIVLLFYDEVRKVYKIVPPAQKVNGGSVDYNRAITIEGYQMIGDIHSHANMSAFHSGVDDADEKSFDGLHITIGNCGSENVSLSASIVSNGQRFIVEPSDYVNKLALTRDIDEEIEKPYSQVYIWDKDQKKMVPKPGKQRTYTVRRFDKRYVVDVSAKYKKFDAKWMDFVEKTAYTYTYGRGGNYWQNWRNRGADGWPNAFNADAWTNFNRQNAGGQQTGKPPLLPAKTTQPVTFPPHHQSADGAHEEVIEKKDFNPCEDCVFKQHRIDWVLEQLAEEEAEDIATEPDDLEIYECSQCESSFSTREFMPVCPVCKIDDFLTLIDDESDLIDTASDIEDVDWFRCDKCNVLFDTVENFPKCPQCKSDGDLVQLQYATTSDDAPDVDDKDYQYKCPHCASETNKLNDGNECPFCNQVVEDPIEQAGSDAEEAMDNLTAAIEADQELERIPIPDQDPPINRREVKKSKTGIFRTLFPKKDKP